ncbi:PTS glucitol/sorbitol transporter subunit IIC, partial [Salmonella enterica subsp. enterica]|nr:PTS glucitol/sorbitol transporter subunit IIC [Salmonella enterica subsp. enterica]
MITMNRKLARKLKTLQERTMIETI